jgi:hypothetical protein
MDYDRDAKTLVLRNRSHVHKLFCFRLEQEIRIRLKAVGASGEAAGYFTDLLHVGYSKLTFRALLNDNTISVNYHMPDSQFMHDNESYPGVVIEIAGSSATKSLDKLAESYFEKSRGRIRAVIGFVLDSMSKKATLLVWRSRVGTDFEGKATGRGQLIYSHVRTIWYGNFLYQS